MKGGERKGEYERGGGNRGREKEKGSGNPDWLIHRKPKWEKK